MFSDESSLKPDNSLQKESKIFNRADLMLLNSQSSQSSQSSQFSSWSKENIPYTLDEINKAFSVITDGKFSLVRYQVRQDITSLKPSTLRSLKRKATTTVHEALDTLAPDQSSKLLKLVSSGKEPPCEPMLEELVIKIYPETSDRRVKHQLLSMISGSYSKKELQQKIPGLSTYAIDLARKNAGSNVRKGIVVGKDEPFRRQRMDRQKLDHALDFFNPAFHKVSSYGTKEMKLQSGDLVTIPMVARTACNSTLINMYQSFCRETDFIPLSRSTLFKILGSCPASIQTNLKGLDNSS